MVKSLLYYSTFFYSEYPPAKQYAQQRHMCWQHVHHCEAQSNIPENIIFKISGHSKIIPFHYANVHAYERTSDLEKAHSIVSTCPNWTLWHSSSLWLAVLCPVGELCFCRRQCTLVHNKNKKINGVSKMEISHWTRMAGCDSSKKIETFLPENIVAHLISGMTWNGST